MRLLFEKPALKAITGFVIYMVIFCLVRLLVDPNDFLNSAWKNITIGLVIGLSISLLIFLVEVKRKREK